MNACIHTYSYFYYPLGEIFLTQGTKGEKEIFKPKNTQMIYCKTRQEEI